MAKANQPEKTGNPIIDNQAERAAATERHDKNRLRWAIGIALAAHLVFLAVRLPQITQAQEPDEEKEEAYVLQQVMFKPPPPPPPKPQPKKEEPPPPDAKKVPVPDTTPEEPEPAPPQPEEPPPPEDVVDFADVPIETPPQELPPVDTEIQIPQPPPPPPEPVGPIRVGGNVKAPVKVSGRDPEYTNPAKAARVEGVVIVEAIIDKQGRVTRTKILKDLKMGLGEQAQEAVKGWRFKPATLNGKPVEVYYNLTVNFTLNKR